MTASVELRDVRENKVLWENPSAHVPAGIRSAERHQRADDPAAFFGQDVNALERMSTDSRAPSSAPSSKRFRIRLRARSTSAPPSVSTDRVPATPDPIYLLQGEDEVEKSALAHEFDELVEEGLRAFNVERIHAGDLTTGDKLADGVASLVAAVRTLPMMAPRRVVIVLQAEALLVPKRESEAAARALDELEALLKAARAADDAGASSRPRRQAQPHVQAAGRSRRRSSNAASLDDLADAERWVRNRVAAAGAADRAGRGAAARRARRHRRQAAAQRRRAPAALRARPEDDHRRRRAGDRRAGGAAGRLGDDERDRSGRRRASRCASSR